MASQESERLMLARGLRVTRDVPSIDRKTGKTMKGDVWFMDRSGSMQTGVKP